MFAKKVFGENVRTLRFQKGAVQEHVANAIGITKQALSRIDTGYRASIIELEITLAEYSGESLDKLMMHNCE